MVNPVHSPARLDMGMGIYTINEIAETDPLKISEYSEKDVMNFLEMVLSEFNIDHDRKSLWDTLWTTMVHCI